MSVKYQTKPEVEELITDNLRLVQSIAWHLHARVSKVIEIDDLIQIGYYGLVTQPKNTPRKKGLIFPIMPVCGFVARWLTTSEKIQIFVAPLLKCKKDSIMLNKNYQASRASTRAGRDC